LGTFISITSRQENRRPVLSRKSCLPAKTEEVFFYEGTIGKTGFHVKDKLETQTSLQPRCSRAASFLKGLGKGEKDLLETLRPVKEKPASI